MLSCPIIRQSVLGSRYRLKVSVNASALLLAHFSLALRKVKHEKQQEVKMLLLFYCLWLFLSFLLSWCQGNHLKLNPEGHDAGSYIFSQMEICCERCSMTFLKQEQASPDHVLTVGGRGKQKNKIKMKNRDFSHITI